MELKYRILEYWATALIGFFWEYEQALQAHNYAQMYLFSRSVADMARIHERTFPGKDFDLSDIGQVLLVLEDTAEDWDEAHDDQNAALKTAVLYEAKLLEEFVEVLPVWAKEASYEQFENGQPFQGYGKEINLLFEQRVERLIKRAREIQP